MKKKLLTALFLFLGVALWSQTKTISGKVTSELDPDGIPGVSVVIKGTTVGTITDVNGNFQITVDENKTLVCYWP